MGKLITIAELMKIANVSEEQALEIISSAVVDYHEMHKHNAELEELLVLTQKCEARARQGVQLAQEAVQVRRSSPSLRPGSLATNSVCTCKRSPPCWMRGIKSS